MTGWSTSRSWSDRPNCWTRGQRRSTNWKVCIHLAGEQKVGLCRRPPSAVVLPSAQLRDIAYGPKGYVFKADTTDEEEPEDFDETLHLERGENFLELQIIGITLSPSALELLGDREPSTFCTYAFYLFELHSTPVVTGHEPKYGFTSKYVVNVDDRFLDYVHRDSVTVELHQALGLDWRTVARAQLRLQQLLEHDGKVHGSVPLVGKWDVITLTVSGQILRAPAGKTHQMFVCLFVCFC